MVRAYLSLVLISLFVLSGSAPVLASPGEASRGGEGGRQVRFPESLDLSQSLWIWNLGDRPAEVRLAPGTTVRVEAGAFREAPAVRSNGAAIRNESRVVLVAASRGFDPGSLELDLQGTVTQEQTDHGRQARVTRPEWAQSLLVKAVAGHLAGPGQTIQAATETGSDGRAYLAVGLVDEDSGVIVTLKDQRGRTIRSFSVSSPVAVRWRADVGSSTEVEQAELKVVRGQVVVGDSTPRGLNPNGIQPKSGGGTSWASPNLVFGGSYSFGVVGGPANTCGELDIKRNSNWEFTPGWFCTDASGNGTKGPWNWSDKTADETGNPIFIRWPDNSTTTDTFIIVDKTPAVAYLDSSFVAPPTSYYGHATDAVWGTGFDYGYSAFSVFQDLSTGNYFDPFTSGYTSSSYKQVTASVTRVNQWYVNWSTVFPPAGAHTHTHNYLWYTCVTDASSGYCVDTRFTP